MLGKFFGSSRLNHVDLYTRFEPFRTQLNRKLSFVTATTERRIWLMGLF